MQAAFAFGKTGLTVSLPDGPQYCVVEGRSAGALADAAAAIGAALDNPIGSKPLVELAAGKKTAAISVCDITRPAPNSLTLPPLLERLHAAGIPVDGVTILIATGLHRCVTGEEINAILGPEIAGRYRVVDHDARALGDHRSLGATASGTPVYIDRRFLDADLHITLGFIEPHWMLGFSGGRKLIAPGLAAQQTIMVLHSPRFMRDPLAIEGSIEGNPLHAELLEIARIARHDFLLDVALTQQRAICGVFAGSPEQAHVAGVDFIRSTTLTRVPHYADAAITSAAGHPLDLTFYQSLKGIHGAHHIVKPGGKILVLCECAEGIGSPEFAAMLHSYAGPKQFLRQIENAPVMIDQWQLEKGALTGVKNKILIYTPGVSPDQLGALGERCYSDVNQAVAALLDGLPAGARVALIPEGPYAFAQVGE
ncbi:MAG: nickel-dependent lactate racemase [Acidobacteriaceae bacterium]|jgi:nickel-dependent lactate racemase